MKKHFLILFALILAFSTAKAQEEEKKEEPLVKISGWVNAETFYDTRQTVSSREGDIYFYPKEVKEQNGTDLNDGGKFNMVGFMSRVRLDARSVEAFGAQVSAKIEIDFLGTTSDYVNMIRMRHAFFNMKWTKTSLLFGQYWHPMFVTECFPQVYYWGAGAPIHVLNRSPQIRLTYNLTNELSVMAAAVVQQYHKGYGIGKDDDGNEIATLSPEAARQSGLPEFQFQAKYKTDGLAAGFTGGYHWVRPRYSSDLNFEENNPLGAYNANAFVTFKTGDLTLKLQGIYGQNMARFVMLGGYAIESVDSSNNVRTYTNTTTGSVWGEAIYNVDKFEVGLYGGFSKNFGANAEVVPGSVAFMRGKTVNNILNVAPRVGFKSGKVKLGFEVIYSTAAYGTADSKLLVSDTKAANNVRFLFSAYRYF